MDFTIKSRKKIIYLDYAATTPVDPLVVKAMQPYWTEKFGNPSSLYSLGVEAKDALENSRQKIAELLNARSDEIIFTSGGTESVNLAIAGVVKKIQSKNSRPHIITTNVEHHAVLHCVEALQKQGLAEVTFLEVDEQGFVSTKQLSKAIKPNTALVSLIYANNEIGTILPIQNFAKELRQVNKTRAQKKLPEILLHTDACQAAGALEMDLAKIGADLVSLNGSKIYGPKQTGILYKRKHVALEPIIYGGGQEHDLRSGTENVAGAVGLATALDLAQKLRVKENKRQRTLRNYLIKKLLKIPGTVLNGAAVENDTEQTPLRLPNNINISIKDVEGEALLLYLDANNICISTGSACTSTSGDPSHVIKALGRGEEYNQGLRFTLGRGTTKQQLDKVLKILPGLVEELRRIKEADLRISETVEFSIRK